MLPICAALKKNPLFNNKICVTGQHTDLLKTFLNTREIKPDYHFATLAESSSLHQMAAHFLREFETIFSGDKPDLILVQGDTTSAFIGALSAFYSHISIGHIEAGLRTRNLLSPWPEEGHRSLIDRLATYFFPPTEEAKHNLLLEGIPPERIWVVGNTSIDAIRQMEELHTPKKTVNRNRVVVTIHRRENHGNRLKDVCFALLELAKEFPKLEIVCLLHPNPNVREPLTQSLGNMKNITLKEPMDHASFIQLLKESHFVITDSGGIQEEASFIGTPVLIIRENTERPEGVERETARLVGTKPESLIASCRELLENEQQLAEMRKVHSPYGDGHAADRIVDILSNELK